MKTSVHSTSCTAAILAAALNLSLTVQAAEVWKRNTYPGQGHKERPEQFPAGMGQDRGQYCTYYGVSPVNSDFQLFCMNMAGATTVYSKDGKSFNPVEMPVTSGAVRGAFSPHDGNTGFLLYGARATASLLPASTNTPLNCLQSGNPSGLWRTTDRGDKWHQIYEVPQNSYYLPVNSLGKAAVTVDPHPNRAGHIYFGTLTDGLIRSTDDGATWQPVAFPGRMIGAVAASHNSTNTSLYAIVGPRLPQRVDGVSPDYLKEPPTTYAAYWALEDNGTDGSGNGNALSLKNFPASPYADGRVGSWSLAFDGANDYAAINKMKYQGSSYGQLTVCAWVRTTSTATRTIASFDGSEYWQLDLRNTGKVQFSVAGATTSTNLIGTKAINDGKWHHVVAQFNAGVIRIYIDGSLDASVTSSTMNTFGTGTVRYGFLGDDSEATAVNGTRGPIASFSGQLDDVRIYPTALTETEIWRIALVAWNGDNRLAEGELWRIDVDETGAVAGVTQLSAPDENFVDVDVNPTDPTTGFVIRDGKPGFQKGGKILSRFTGSGSTFTPIPAANTDNVFMAYVYINPHNPDHVVINCATTLVKGALRYSIDGGTTWLGKNHTVKADGTCADFISYSPLLHQYYPDGSLPTTEDAANQGPCVGFKSDDPNGVYWWMLIHAKTDGLSTDQGKSFKPYAYGGSNKEAHQLAVSEDGKRMIQAMGEYGFASTANGGLSWIGTNDENDNHMKALWDQSWDEYPNDNWANHRMGWGVTFNPGNPNLAVALYSSAPYIIRTTNGGTSWNQVINPSSSSNYKASSRGVVFWHRQATNTVYAADMKSTDGGLHWSGMTSAGSPVYVLAMSSENGNVLLGHQLTSSLNPEEVNSGNWNLLASKDGGATWIALPDPVKETIPGMTAKYQVIKFTGGSNGEPSTANVAIDPNPAHDPTVGSNKLRVLLPGRSGIYEYIATGADNLGGTAWTIRSNGLVDSVIYNKTDPVPWMGLVTFDARPGMHNVVYAAQTTSVAQLGMWHYQADNTNRRFQGGQPYQPFYKSTDGGLTWSNLHSLPGEVPQYHFQLGGLSVDGNGTFYTTSHSGIYLLTDLPDAVTASFDATPIQGDAPLAVTFTDTSTGAITNRIWSFGDGQMEHSSAPTITHTYTTPGTYTVSLTAVAADGWDTQMRVGYITVEQPAVMLQNWQYNDAAGTLTKNALNTGVPGDLVFSGTATVLGTNNVINGTGLAIHTGTYVTKTVAMPTPITSGTVYVRVDYASWSLTSSDTSAVITEMGFQDSAGKQVFQRLSKGKSSNTPANNVNVSAILNIPGTPATTYYGNGASNMGMTNSTGISVIFGVDLTAQTYSLWTDYGYTGTYTKNVDKALEVPLGDLTQFRYSMGGLAGNVKAIDAIMIGQDFTDISTYGITITPPPPEFGGIVVNGTNLVLTGSGGELNGSGSYLIYSATNLALPLNQWTILSTNLFNADGSFTNALPIVPGEERRFYRLQLQ